MDEQKSLKSVGVVSSDSDAKKKPKWLRQLEQESWQAELVISGLAIYGALQIPGLIESAAQGLIVKTGSGKNLLLYLIFFYMLACGNLLIFTFISHFILRAVWIGLVGLNSVFPEGIKEESKMYAPHFMNRLRRDFPNKNLGIQELDNLCSILFAFSAYFVLVILTIAGDIAILYLLKIGLELFLPPSMSNLIVGFLVILLFVGVLSNLFFNHKKIREKAWVKKVHYPTAMLIGKIVLHIFYRPITYLGFTFMTNINLRQYIGATMVFFLAVLGISMYQLFSGSSVLYLMNKSPLYSQYERTDRTYPEVYENLRGPDDGMIMTAVIESEQVNGDFLKVFVPIFDNEKTVLDSLCGNWAPNVQLSRTENRKKSRQFWLDCYSKYHQFYINDHLLQVELVKHTHHNKGEKGVLTFISTRDFKLGKNILRVEKIRAENGKVYRTMNIPFWYAAKVNNDEN